MQKENNRKLTFLLVFSIVLSIGLIFGQKGDKQVKKVKLHEFTKDSLALIINTQAGSNTEIPDTNFTYEKYMNFLQKVSDKKKYLVLPINEFRKVADSTRIVIGLRHDVDLDLGKAICLSEVEKSMGYRSTYYILHTANYYLAHPEDKSVHNEAIIPILRYMQDESGFEIGWHNDLVTLQVKYNIDPVAFLHQELKWLRDNGLKITGTASHGSPYCHEYSYLNYYFFNECTDPPAGLGKFPNNKFVPVNSKIITLKKGNLNDFGLEYEAYFLNNNKYFSDASIVNGQRWDIGMLDLNALKPGDRVIILMHPIYWHKGSRLAEIRSFTIPGQKSSVINAADSSVTVIMPVGSAKKQLSPSFKLSPGAYSKCFSSLQTEGSSINDYDKPVIYTVYAENRNYKKRWTINVQNAEPSECMFESFIIAGFTKKVNIDTKNKTISLKVSETADLTGLIATFSISRGATAWIKSKKQRSSTEKIDFTNPVKYKIVGADNVTTCEWTVTISK